MQLNTLETLLKIRRPYYILAPDYRKQSAGIRAMHLLCHILNRAGEEAYIITKVAEPQLQTPQLTPAIEQKHQKAKASPIAVYPEVVFDNPLDLTSVARIVLNHPGLINGPKDFPKTELLFFYNPEYAESLPDRAQRLLQIPIINTALFNNLENRLDSTRKEKLVYPGHYKEAAESFPELFKDAIVVTRDWPETHPELANLLRSAAKIYCFSNSAIAQEAVLCGCPVIFVETPFTKNFIDTYRHNPLLGRPPGMAIDLSEAELVRARSSIAEFAAIQRHTDFCFLEQLASFIQETQAMPVQEGENTTQLQIAEIKYKNWLDQRTFINTDTKFLFDTSITLNPSYKFQLVMRLPAGSEHLLADTLDSLDQQVNSDWHLDIFTTLPTPEGIDEIPNIEWHTIDTSEEVKASIDFVVQAKKIDWIIELPAGARLDILFLWRMTYEIQTTPHARVFFFDDDCCTSDGNRFDPRFKPGVNMEALRSADLAGPICVRTDTWQTTGGASQHSGSPWFEKLLQITDKSGWGTIKHIPDILITYLDYFPTDHESCHLALSDSLKTKGIEGEIRSVTSQSWGVRYELKTPPAVTVAILSTGQFELAKRCFSSVLKSTHYPNYEILIVTNKIDGDPDFDHWLRDIQKQSQPQNIRVIYVASNANYATRCNAAMATSKNQLVVLTREETVFVQDIWLEELVSSFQQSDIVAVSPLIHQASDAKILASGNTLGLLGDGASPYSGIANLGEAGYLDCLQVTKDTITLPSYCFLTRKTAYDDVGGMDEIELGDHYSETDLCLKYHKNGHRLIVHPRASIIYSGQSSLYDLKQGAEATVKKITANETLRQRWGTDAIVDPYWNINLSLSNSVPTPETEYRPLWQYLPTNKPHILAHPLGNSQGDLRVTSPLTAVRKAGLASECIWRQKIGISPRYFSAGEIARLEPTSVIIQNYIYDIGLLTLNDWSLLKNRPFIVYTLDDLINDLDKSNPVRKFFPPNARSRLKYALSKCDRLVLSTDFLADTYRHFISDIKVVPNRLEKDTWLPLNSLKRTSKKPRIGWAGGSTHEGDLILLKEIIEQTRNEADWIFFGMCPKQIRPLLTEYHELVPFDQYPTYLASLNLDIAVAPLAMTPFNQGKSNLRLLEYGALGIPVVCTDIDPYQNSPACRVKNSANAWVAALRERIYDAEEREKEGRAMRDWVHNSYLLEDHLDDWLSAHLPG